MGQSGHNFESNSRVNRNLKQFHTQGREEGSFYAELDCDNYIRRVEGCSEVHLRRVGMFSATHQLHNNNSIVYDKKQRSGEVFFKSLVILRFPEG